MLSEKEIYKFIKALILRIKYLEANDPDNPNLDKLKLLLSDNVSEEGKIRIKPSSLNKQAHLFFSNCTDHMYNYKKKRLCN
jgi:hypothetical protein